MAKAVHMPSGKWRCQAYHQGQRKSFTADTRKEAEYLAREWQTDRKELAKTENRTVRDVMTEYIDERSNILSPTTIDGYRRIMKNYFHTLQEKKIHNVTRRDVQREINEMAARLSPKTIANAVGFLRSACGFTFTLTLPKKEKKQYQTPGRDGIREILTKTRGTDVEVPTLLALWCGLRMSEIRGLRWDHVFEDHLLIDKAMVYTTAGDVIKTPKNGQTRTVDIPPELYTRIMADRENGSEYVTALSAIVINKHFRRLTGGICRFHDLRHANASVMMALGIPDNVAMARGGWETESIYKKTYAQILPESKAASSEAIDKFFLDLLQ